MSEVGPVVDEAIGYELTDQARAVLAELGKTGRELMMVDDPDDLLGDKQIRALDRLHHRETPECGAQWGDLICTRPVAHLDYGTRHVTACGTQRWEGMP